MKKKFLALVLALVMTLTLLPVTALAATKIQELDLTNIVKRTDDDKVILKNLPVGDYALVAGPIEDDDVDSTVAMYLSMFTEYTFGEDVVDLSDGANMDLSDYGERGQLVEESDETDCIVFAVEEANTEYEVFDIAAENSGCLVIVFKIDKNNSYEDVEDEKTYYAATHIGVAGERRTAAYTITLDRDNYDGFYLKLDAYTNAGVWVGEIGNDDDPDEVTLSVPKDGYVVVGAAGNFTAAADGATVGDLQPSDELSSRKITNFTKNTTIIINPKITVSEVTLKVDWTKVPELKVGDYAPAFDQADPGEEHYFTITCDGLAGYVYAWAVEDNSSENLSGWRVISGSDTVVTNGEKYALLAEVGLQDGYVLADNVTLKLDDGAVAKITGQDPGGMGIIFELGTLEEIEDAKNPPATDTVVDEVTLKVDWTKVPELVVGEPVPDPVMFDAAVEHYMTVTCENLDGFQYGWSVKDPSTGEYSGVTSANNVTSTDEYYLTVIVGLKTGGKLPDDPNDVTLKVDGGTFAEIAFIEHYDGDDGGDWMAIMFELGTLEDIEDAKDNANTPAAKVVSLENLVKVNGKTVNFDLDPSKEYYVVVTEIDDKDDNGLIKNLVDEIHANTLQKDVISSPLTASVIDDFLDNSDVNDMRIYYLDPEEDLVNSYNDVTVDDGAFIMLLELKSEDKCAYTDEYDVSVDCYITYGIYATYIPAEGSGTTGDNTGSDKPVVKPTTTPSYDPTPVVPPANVDIHDDTLYDAAQAVYAAVKNGKADFTPVAGYTKEEVIQMQKDDALKLVVEKKSSFDPTEKALIDKTVEEKVKGALVQFLEIDVTLRTMADVIVAEVDDTILDLSITVDLNDEMQKAAKDGKTIYVARSHDGKVAFLEGKLNADKTKVTFDSSKFSTYALVAFDSKVVTAPQTADAGIILAVSMSILSVTGSAMLLKKKED